MGSETNLSLDIETKAVASGHVSDYVPSVLTVRAERAISKLMSLSEGSIRELMPAIVDYEGLIDMVTALHALRGSTDDQNKKLKLILELAEHQLKLTKSRRNTLHTLASMPLRLSGEESQMESDRIDLTGSGVSARERERVHHNGVLWNTSAVWVDIDTMPANCDTGDEAERRLPEITGARILKGLTHRLLKVGSFADLEKQLKKVAKDTTSLEAYGVNPNDTSESVGFIREVHLFGHGRAGLAPSAGDSGRQPAFWMFGLQHKSDLVDLTSLTTEAEQSGLAGSFGLLRRYMVPGGSIVFRGCEVGKGDMGKIFLALVGHWCFGDDRWGFLRANGENVIVPPAAVELGPPFRSAVTYKWPDDLKGIANRALG